VQTEASHEEASAKAESTNALYSKGKLAGLARLERAARCLEVSLIGANELYVGPFFVVFIREIGFLMCSAYACSWVFWFVYFTKDIQSVSIVECERAGRTIGRVGSNRPALASCLPVWQGGTCREVGGFPPFSSSGCWPRRIEDMDELDRKARFLFLRGVSFFDRSPSTQTKT
jgi:hypothetical protein